ncbi:hypothetical protein ACSAZK_13695 [Methanosarcina sp. Mfa9]|uniref:hypothetical protein n=1 Tax=Methanosarcina sp. Mfa9 TaxID=3439063 RepID=UPI003F83959E
MFTRIILSEDCLSKYYLPEDCLSKYYLPEDCLSKYYLPEDCLSEYYLPEDCLPGYRNTVNNRDEPVQNFCGRTGISIGSGNSDHVPPTEIPDNY